MAELARACELPLSTAYRKVDRLVAAGLLAERTRLDPDRNHESEYVPGAADVSVSVSGDGELTVTVVDAGGDESRPVTISE